MSVYVTVCIILSLYTYMSIYIYAFKFQDDKIFKLQTHGRTKKNKATGWLGALVRVTKLKFWFLRLRDKMLVFAGVVKKCLQHGHSFRLAGVWLKSENVRFACAVTRFCSSRVKKKTLEIYDFQSSESYQGDIHSSSFFLFSTLAVPERLWQCRSHSLPQGSVVTPSPAVGPSVPFFVHVLFFLRSIDGGRHFFKCFHVPSICWVPATMAL